MGQTGTDMAPRCNKLALKRYESYESILKNRVEALRALLDRAVSCGDLCESSDIKKFAGLTPEGGSKAIPFEILAARLALAMEEKGRKDWLERASEFSLLLQEAAWRGLEELDSVHLNIEDNDSILPYILKEMDLLNDFKDAFNGISIEAIVAKTIDSEGKRTTDRFISIVDIEGREPVALIDHRLVDPRRNSQNSFEELIAAGERRVPIGS